MGLNLNTYRVLFVFGLAGIFLSSCSSKSNYQSRGSGRLGPAQWESPSPTVVGSGSSRAARHPVTYDIPVVHNSDVQRWMDYFQGRGAQWYRIWMERSGRYVPFMRQILREHGVPEDLVYLSMIESGFSSKAYSRARAVGMWQFMVGTGRIYDLRVNFWVDERRDPEKATIAAARHLKDLYNHFNDWYLAFSAYNAGQGRVNRAIRRAKTNNFWALSEARVLPRETRNYVPKMLAAMIIGKNLEQFGFLDIAYDEPLSYDKFIVRKPVNLQNLAKRAGFNLEELLRLNPELNYPVTPPDVREYELRIPKRTAEKFVVAMKEMPDEELFQYANHRVQRGETISAIASRYRTSASEIMRLNNIRSARSLQIGQSLLLPVPSGVNLPPPVHRHVAGPVRVTDNSGFYSVRRGDNLWTISRAFRVSVSAIRSANGLRNDHLRIGQRLRIPGQGLETKTNQPSIQVSSSSTQPGRVEVPESGLRYRVRRGDTLTGIARRHGLSLEELRAANRLRSDSIQVGQNLNIPGKGLVSAESEPRVHVVRRGENLWMISRRYGVTIGEIRSANRIRGDQLRIGQRLTIPAVGTAEGSNLSPSERTVHVVRRGENLWMISQRYGTSIGAIKRVNNLSESRIVPGAKLVIPANAS